MRYFDDPTKYDPLLDIVIQIYQSASLSRALVGSLYIKIIIPTYSRRPPLTENRFSRFCLLCFF